MVIRDIKKEELVEIVRYLGAEDLKFLDSLRRKRWILGVIFNIAGLGIMIGSVFYANLAGSQGWMWFLFGLFIGSLLMREGSVAIQESRSIAVPGGGRYKVYVKLTCTNPDCGYVEIRERKNGEYVGQILETTCPKCGSKLVVSAIFSEPEKKIKTIGMPILPAMGQTSTVKLLGYYLLDTLSPFKVAFKLVKRGFKRGKE